MDFEEFMQQAALLEDMDEEDATDEFLKVLNSAKHQSNVNVERMRKYKEAAIEKEREKERRRFDECERLKEERERAFQSQMESCIKIQALVRGHVARKKKKVVKMPNRENHIFRIQVSSARHLDDISSDLTVHVRICLFNQTQLVTKQQFDSKTTGSGPKWKGFLTYQQDAIQKFNLNDWSVKIILWQGKTINGDGFLGQIQVPMSLLDTVMAKELTVQRWFPLEKRAPTDVVHGEIKVFLQHLTPRIEPQVVVEDTSEPASVKPFLKRKPYRIRFNKVDWSKVEPKTDSNIKSMMMKPPPPPVPASEGLSLPEGEWNLAQLRTAVSYMCGSKLTQLVTMKCQKEWNVFLQANATTKLPVLKKSTSAFLKTYSDEEQYVAGYCELLKEYTQLQQPRPVSKLKQPKRRISKSK